MAAAPILIVPTAGFEKNKLVSDHAAELPGIANTGARLLLEEVITALTAYRVDQALRSHHHSSSPRSAAAITLTVSAVATAPPAIIHAVIAA